MFYALKDNVYLVQGKMRSCIYDFNSSKLYSVNNMLAEKINLVNNGQIESVFIDKSLNEIFNKFIEMGILILSEEPISREIDEIKTSDLKCSFAWIEITNKCNLRCQHCYNESNTNCDTVMSLEHYKIVIDSLLKLGVRAVQIIGGEPFFDKHILRDMFNYTVGKFKTIEIFTNGTLITSDWCRYLSDNDVNVALSVYSYNDEIHDNVTGCKGSWEKTNKTIAALKKYGITYRVCNVLMKDIELGEKNNNLYELSDEKDVVRMSGRANFSLLSNELIKKCLITKKNFQIPIKKNLLKELFLDIIAFKIKYISLQIWKSFHVMERRFKHCVIDENNQIVLDKNIRFFTKDNVNECKYCEYRYACFDCRANSLSYNIFEKPWYCTYNPRLGEWEAEDEFIVALRKNGVRNRRFSKIYELVLMEEY